MSQASVESSEVQTQSQEMSHMETTNEETLKDGGNLDAADDGEIASYYAVFVMNLPELASEEDVRKHFEKETTVKSISFLRNAAGKFCGYAVVELPDEASFEAALKLMGTEMNGKSVYVIPHRNIIKPLIGKYGPIPYSVLIFNVPLTATEDDVRKHFEEKISVKSVRVYQSPQPELYAYSYVELPDKEAFEAALRMMGSEMNGLNLIVVAHRTLINPDKGKDEARPLKLLVSNIPPSLNLRSARRIFLQAGIIKTFFPTFMGKRSGKNQWFESDWSATITVKTMEIFLNILKMDGIIVGGQTVKVEPLVQDVKGAFKRFAECAQGVGFAKRPKFADSDEDEDEPDNPLKLFLGHLHPSTTGDDILELLKDAGEVISCWVPDEKMRKKSKAAYVIMADEKGKEKALALSGTVLNDMVLKIHPYLKIRGPYGRIFIDQEWLQKPNVVIASNIPGKSSEEDVRQHFQAAGAIESVRFPRDNSLPLAYLEMGDKESYEKILLLNNAYMGRNRVSVMQTSSDLVRKSWVDLKAQQDRAKDIRRIRMYGRKPRNKKGGGSEKEKISLDPESVQQLRELKKEKKDIRMEARRRRYAEKKRRRRQARKLKKTLSLSQNAEHEPAIPILPNTTPVPNNSGASNNTNADKGARTFGLESRMDGDGQGSLCQASNNNGSRMYEKSGSSLDASKQKEMEQAALAALSDLEARKSISNIYPAPNTNSSSSVGNLHSSNSNTYNRI